MWQHLVGGYVLLELLSNNGKYFIISRIVFTKAAPREEKEYFRNLLCSGTAASAYRHAPPGTPLEY